MIASHIHDALSQVRRLQEMLIERRGFYGYSGTARMAGGVAALAGAAVLASPRVPPTPGAHLAGWASVLTVSLAVNYGALALWFRRDREARGEWLKLMPAADAIPILAVGALLSLALIVRGQFDLLFGTWMCVYGLVHIPYRLSLPRTNYLVGLFYLVCGSACLLAVPSFLNHWPMGLVFFAGETAGGDVLRRYRESHVPQPAEASADQEEPSSDEA